MKIFFFLESDLVIFSYSPVGDGQVHLLPGSQPFQNPFTTEQTTPAQFNVFQIKYVSRDQLFGSRRTSRTNGNVGNKRTICLPPSFPPAFV